MSLVRSIPWGALAVAGLCFLVSISTPATAGRPTGSTVAGASTTAPPLVYHAALYVNVSGPTGSTAPGELVSAEYSVLARTYPGSPAPATVEVPSSIVAVPTSTSTIHLYLGPENLSLSGNGTATAMAGPATRFSTALTFPATSIAFLSTQGIALQASWPSAQDPVAFQWRLVMIAADGSTSDGPWSTVDSVIPAGLATFSPAPPKEWALDGSYLTCITGPIAGRTFSVHVSTSTPVAQYATNPVTVPPSQPTSVAFCWNSTLPATITPQLGYVHLWEYGNVTYLLDVVQVSLTTSQTYGSTPSASGGMPSWEPWLVLGAIVAAGFVAFEAYLLLIRPRAAGAVPPPPPAAMDPGGAGPAAGDGTVSTTDPALRR